MFCRSDVKEFSSFAFQIIITANVVLTKDNPDKTTSYSIFYGQSFAHDYREQRDEDSYRGEGVDDELAAEEETAQEKTQIWDRFTATNVEEFKANFPQQINHDVIISRFQRAINDSSDVVVHSVVNVVVLYLALVDTPIDDDVTEAFGIPRLSAL